MPVALQGNGSHQVTWTIPIQRGPTRLLVAQILHTPTPGPQRDPDSPASHQPVAVQPFNQLNDIFALQSCRLKSSKSPSPLGHDIGTLGSPGGKGLCGGTSCGQPPCPAKDRSFTAAASRQPCCIPPQGLVLKQFWKNPDHSGSFQAAASPAASCRRSSALSGPANIPPLTHLFRPRVSQPAGPGTSRGCSRCRHPH